MSSLPEGDRPSSSETPDIAAELPACKCTNERDRHLFCPGPKRILALDGGGVRGAITVAFLEQIEKVLSDRLGEPIHLANWFDLIGGTSTGAVIAGRTGARLYDAGHHELLSRTRAESFQSVIMAALAPKIKIQRRGVA